MTDSIRGLTVRLANEPASLAFLELGEALRLRGQLEAAYKVARGGLGRYPGLADAHDLVARVLCDTGDLAGAFDAWTAALRLDPMRAGAQKGIGFLYFRAGDPGSALEHLVRAAEADPDDPAIPGAIDRARKAAARTASAPAGSPRVQPQPALEPEPPLPSEPTAAAEGGTIAPSTDGLAALDAEGGGLLLIDGSGLRLAGALPLVGGSDVSDEVAALLAGVSKEATRAARLLGLGAWRTIAAESPDGHFHLTAPTDDSLLLMTRPPHVPMARVALAADHAARAAQRWMETGR